MDGSGGPATFCFPGGNLAAYSGKPFGSGECADGMRKDLFRFLGWVDRFYQPPPAGLSDAGRKWTATIVGLALTGPGQG